MAEGIYEENITAGFLYSSLAVWFSQLLEPTGADDPPHRPDTAVPISSLCTN